jgi:hypothetical protein
VRQADYKYTYSDRSNTTLKSEQADLLVQAVERFKSAGLNINLEEVFVWYFEQKGVENVERFIMNNNQNNLLSLPIMQMIAQNMQNGKAEQLVPNEELQNEENKEV